MSKANRIVVIGGTACGPKSAARARRCDPSARITLIEQGENLSSATCGLPYYVSGVIKKRADLVTRKPDYFRDVMDLEVLVGTRAIAVNPGAHEVEVLDLNTLKRNIIGYDRLVLATGSTPAVPNFPGKDLKGIFTLTSVEDSAAIRRYLSRLKTKDVTIVGAGLIGIETAEALVECGFKVTVIEALNWLLPTLLDAEIAAYVQKNIGNKNLKFLFGQRVSGFEGNADKKVRRVITSDGEIKTGMVLLSLGVRPNVNLAGDAGLTIGSTGGLEVNNLMQTSDPDIYAGGDCVENVNRITGRKMLAPMGSTANKHGRIIGTNVTGGHDTFPGVLGTAVAKVFGYNVARTGLSELQAKEAGYETEISLVPGEEHATYYPGSRGILVKLIAEKGSGRLLGGQIVGKGETAKRADVLATALSFGAGIEDVANIDLAYAPPYNSAMDPLHHAANVIRNKQAGYARTLTSGELKKKLDDKEDFVLLDVRSEEEWNKDCFVTGQARLIPLSQLRQRLGELPKDKEIVLHCQISIRAYQALRILDGAGFKNVRFLDGSLSAWPYEEYKK